MSTSYHRASFEIHARHFRIPVGKITKIMGIINCTPDSFSLDGLLKRQTVNVDTAVRYALKLIGDGADLIDVGGESTRPGSRPISTAEEIRRVIPTIRMLVPKVNVPISIDTYKEDVARAALEAGASIVNNIMGTKISRSFLKTVRDFDAAIVLMHIRGTPQTMQDNVHYRHLVPEIAESLKNSVEKCLEIGIKSDKIIIDPGIGFAKTAEQNFEILRRLREFGMLKRPVLVGPSRKSFIGQTLRVSIKDRLIGTVASVVTCAFNGAHIVRVHDVKAVRQALTITDKVLPE